MPKPTRTTVAVAIAFVVVATYGACVVALDASMYGALIVMPHATTVGILTILLAALGLVHLVSLRLVPSHPFHLLLLILEVVCASVLLGMAVHGATRTTKAIEIAPVLATYQHRMEAYLASDKARQFNYSESLLGYRRDGESNGMPYRPTAALSDEAYPRDAAKTFSEAYCLSEGHRFCSAFPLVQTIVFPGIWNNPNVTADVKRNLSTLPATLANVTVTASTTLDSFCARINITIETPRFPMSAAEHAMFVARLDDPVRKFNKDLKYLCDGCAALSKVATKHAALQTWIHDTCPMTVPKPSGAGCVKAVDCHEFSGRTPSRSAFTEFCFDSTYRNPSYDTCFGHTLMSVAQTYDRAVAIASGVVLLLLLLLFARVWVVHRVQEYQDTLRDATVQTPVDNA